MLDFLIGLLLFSISVVAHHSSLSTSQLRSLQEKFESYYDASGDIGVKGITLGGWLVLEPYITPSLFEQASRMRNTKYVNTTIIDEWTLCETLGYNASRLLLEEHYRTWITEDDFRQIKNDGFNLVRIPVGYWAWKLNADKNLYLNNITYKDPYVGEGLQLQYLEKALQWAQALELNVWIDLHGAPGSQNGFDNSGLRILLGNLGWLNMETTKSLTQAVWGDMFHRYANQTDNSPVVGIEIVNEPLAGRIELDDITQAYYEALYMFHEYHNISAHNMSFVIHDAFQDIGHWNMHLNPNYKNVSSQYYNLTNVTFESSDIIVDHHHYEVFTPFQLNNSQYDRIMDIVNYAESIHDTEKTYHPAIVGEWSAAITDCARWVNGIGVGSRYNGTYAVGSTQSEYIGNCTSQSPISEWPLEYKQHVRQFVEAQLASYSMNTQGWIFWNWKTESAPEWDYVKLRDNGLFPQPFNNYTYFKGNGSSLLSSLSREAKKSSSKMRSGSQEIAPTFWVTILAVFMGMCL